MNKANDHRLILLVVLSIAYMAIKLLCNLLYLKHISVTVFDVNLVFTGSALFFSLVYILSDAIAFISNRKIAIIIIIVGTILDGVYSIMFYLITQLTEPTVLSKIEAINNSAVNFISPSIFNLYVYGCIASVVAAIAELFLFLFIVSKINNFTLSTIISTVTVLLFHNSITYAAMLRGMVNQWKIFSVNLIIEVSVIIVYSVLVSFSVNLIREVRLKM